MELITLKEVGELLGISQVSLWKIRKVDARFPEPLGYSKRNLKFRKDEIESWMARQ